MYYVMMMMMKGKLAVTYSDMRIRCVRVSYELVDILLIPTLISLILIFMCNNRFFYPLPLYTCV